jgi:tRNA threonylcarbamoyladenosine biosynthesis protein TsaE
MSPHQATLTLRSERDTKQLALAVAGEVRWGSEIGLSGDLGAGKTTFVRFLVGALGGSEALVASPSFALQYEYELPNSRRLEHWDLYRLRELPDELMEPPADDTLRVIEWPEMAKGYLESLPLRIKLELSEDGGRSVKIEGQVGFKISQIFANFALK